MSTNNRIIFLDIDGVLNNCQKHPISNTYTINPDCVYYLNHIIEQTDAKLVITSTWRNMVHIGTMEIAGLEYMLRTHGINAEKRIIGITRIDRNLSDKHDRGRQISDWITSYRRTDQQFTYVVLDDDDEIGIKEAGHPVVQPNKNHGLVNKEAEQAIAILNGKSQSTRVSTLETMKANY